MREEDEEEWIAFTHMLVEYGPFAQCKICDKNLIAEEVGTHLIKWHPKEANKTKKMVRQRLDWEAKQVLS